MPVDMNDLSETELQALFGVPEPPTPGTFEFALVMGGTVSAGAYTAGAVDFLIEAMDCLSAAQAAGAAPPHKAVLKLITGTSGGGVNAAITARALAYDFTHDVGAKPLADRSSSGNPFYDVWINTLRLVDFLDTSDLTTEIRSALNGAPIDRGAQSVAAFSSGPAKARPWVAAPLGVILTLTNVRGVPYRTDLGGGLAQNYVDHADYARFRFVYPGQAVPAPRPDEETLGFDGTALPQGTTWTRFSQFACATAAFPFGFPPRPLARPSSHYRYRAVPYPPEPVSQQRIVQIKPNWLAMSEDGGNTIPEQWEFLSVDGGATDNEPIQLARTALAGLLGRNPRDPNTANRAVWLIDPFAGEAALGPKVQTTLLGDASAILSTFTQQTRYDTADLLMATDPNVFSRFMLTPAYQWRVGASAIASSGLGAFIGFACPDFMRFDYKLGRANCQAFLRGTFTLGDANPLFKDWAGNKWQGFMGTHRQVVKNFAPEGEGDNRLPIVPLVGSAAADVLLDPWPVGKLDPTIYRDGIDARYRRLLEIELSGTVGKSLIGRLGAWTTQQYASEYFITAMNKYLESAKL